MLQPIFFAVICTLFLESSMPTLGFWYKFTIIFFLVLTNGLLILNDGNKTPNRKG